MGFKVIVIILGPPVIHVTWDVGCTVCKVSRFIIFGFEVIKRPYAGGINRVIEVLFAGIISAQIIIGHLLVPEIFSEVFFCYLLMLSALR